MPPESSLAVLLEPIPDQFLPQDARATLRDLFAEMDGLLFLDQFGELNVDRRALIHLSRNEKLVPPKISHLFLVETAKHLGHRVRDFKNDSGQRIPWTEGWKHGLPARPMSRTDVEALGITEATPESEVADIATKLVPEVPALFINDDPAGLAQTLLEQLERNRTYWACLVANLGFWAALTFIGGLLIFIILALSGVPWPVALLIAGIYQTGATLYFLLQCAANPQFQQ
jgi:hypothetical protein